ncbi:hypothetical protein STEG23_023330, partial [Scotinomys teguina]
MQYQDPCPEARPTARVGDGEEIPMMQCDQQPVALPSMLSLPRWIRMTSQNVSQGSGVLCQCVQGYILLSLLPGSNWIYVEFFDLLGLEVCEELCWNFDGDYTESVDYFWNVPYISDLSKTFIMKRCWTLLKTFSASNEKIIPQFDHFLVSITPG